MIIGVIIIAIFVVARNHNNSSNSNSSGSGSTPTASASSSSAASTPSASSAPTSTAQSSSSSITSASPAATPVAANADLAPVGIVAHYNSNGATIHWAPASGAAPVSTYNVEISSDGGQFKLVATVPSTQLSLDVTETDTVGWCSFRVSAVYSDGTVVPGKVFGLPGQYS